MHLPHGKVSSLNHEERRLSLAFTACLSQQDSKEESQMKREISVHVRLSEEADAILEILAEVRGHDKGRVASDIIHRCLLGETYNIRIAAERLVSAGLIGRYRD